MNHKVTIDECEMIYSVELLSIFSVKAFRLKENLSCSQRLQLNFQLTVNKITTGGCPKCPKLLPRKFLLSCPNVPTFGTFGASKLVGPKLLTKIAFYHYLIFSLDKTHFPSMQTRLTHKTRLFCSKWSFIEDKNKSISIS